MSFLGPVEFGKGLTLAIPVEFWTWSLKTTDEENTANASLLSPDEAARAARFVMEKHARRFRAGRSQLRRILGRLKEVPPEDVAFSYNHNGKPETDGGLLFNLSHSKDIAVLVTSQNAPHGLALGVDVECHRSVEHDVAQRFFSASENDALSRLSGEEWVSGFFRCWTRKEAVVKALGDGLSLPLDSFDVTLEAASEAKLTRLASKQENLSDWAMKNVDLGSELACAIAVRSCGEEVNLKIRQGPINLTTD